MNEQSILQKLLRMEASIEAGDPPEPSVLEALCDALRADPRQIPRSDARDVVDALDRLSVWAEACRDEMAIELSRLREGRKAMRGYSSLRSAKVSQRLRREA
ncbi:MAG: hypothetical protein AAFV53_35145 [Myxococcota bacterium]